MLSTFDPMVAPDLQSSPTQAYLLEEALLGAILLDHAFVLPHLKWFKPEFFILEKNRAVYRSMLDLFNRGEAVDIMTVYDELRLRGVLVETGGAPYLTQCTNNCESSYHALTYAQGIYESYRKRKTWDLAGHIANAAARSDTDSAINLAGEMTKLLAEGYREANPLKQWLVRADELKTLPTVSWLIPGEIPELGLVALFGPSGVGKSFVALDYAMRLGQQHPVVYIAAEGQSGYRQRVEAWCKHHDQSEGEVYFFLRDVSIMDDTERRQFIDLIRDIKPCMVVVDTLAGCFTGDENSTRDMSLFVRAAGKLKLELSCSVVLVHHTGKVGSDARGSSALRAACDVMIKLIDEDDQIAVECNKTKDAQPFATRYLSLLPVELEGGAFIPVPIASNKIVHTANDPLSQKQLKVLRALSGEVFAEGAAQGELAEASGIAPNSIWNVMNRLLKLGHARRVGGQRPYLITEQGRSLLRDQGLLEYDPKLTELTPTHVKLIPLARQHDAKTHETHVFTENGDELENSTHHELHELDEFMSFERKKNSSNSSQRELLSLSSTAPRKPCPVCGDTNYRPDPVFGWKCKTCDKRSRQLDETVEVM